MTEENKFKPIDSEPLYDDGIGYVTLYDASHANESEEQRIWTVATIASLAYGNEEAKNPKRLYEKLKELKHFSLFEFIRNGAGRYDIEYSMRNGSDDYHGDGEYDTFNSLHKANIACFKIKVPIFVARQFMRHRSFSYLEMSRRYTTDKKQPFEFWFPKDFGDKHKTDSWIDRFNKNYEYVKDMEYHTQVASRFLPQTTYTTFYMMGEVEGLKNFFALRLKKDAQDEIRELAEGMMRLLNHHQPELAYKVTP